MDHSIKRGYTKDTNILNGTRYLKIINCVPALPLNTSFGRFKVRVFADNDRTPCIHCNNYNHPSCRCQNKMKPKTSWYSCGLSGHVQLDCPHQSILYKFDKYGEYMNEIEDPSQDTHIPVTTNGGESIYLSITPPVDDGHNEPETPPDEVACVLSQCRAFCPLLSPSCITVPLVNNQPNFKKKIIINLNSIIIFFQASKTLK